MVAPIVTPPRPRSAPMGRRLRQTLDGLLRGLAEKQIARELSISIHTVHVYVRELYRRYGVNARGELLALWISGCGRDDALRQTAKDLLKKRRALLRELARLDRSIDVALDQIASSPGGAAARCWRAR